MCSVVLDDAVPMDARNSRDACANTESIRGRSSWAREQPVFHERGLFSAALSGRTDLAPWTYLPSAWD
jgi:hypothetical protein